MIPWYGPILFWNCLTVYWNKYQSSLCLCLFLLFLHLFVQNQKSFLSIIIFFFIHGSTFCFSLFQFSSLYSVFFDPRVLVSFGSGFQLCDQYYKLYNGIGILIDSESCLLVFVPQNCTALTRGITFFYSTLGGGRLVCSLEQMMWSAFDVPPWPSPKNKNRNPYWILKIWLESV